jgi:uncharacterized SAM-binding protein YcdF (DUF218 family)
VNGLVAEFGLQSWKVVVTALVLPPLPLLVLALVGARMIAWRRGVGWLVLWVSLAALYLTHCAAVGEWMMRTGLRPPPPLGTRAVAALRQEVALKRPVAIVALGGGAESRAPEYGVSNLTSWSLERLRYALWLARETGAPVAFSGGIGHGQGEGTPEAEVAARIAVREFGRPIRWAETDSRDTRENALRMVPVLKADGITRIVLVTHAWHMPRALRAFEDVAQRLGGGIEIIPAPIAWAPRVERPLLRWLPSAEGYTLVRQVLREGLGLLMGA